MSSKIQGEGDYEAARRFNKDEQEFVKRKYSKRHKAEKRDSAIKMQEGNDNDALEHASQQPRNSGSDSQWQQK